MKEKLMMEMLGKKTWAVVGASPDVDKISNKIIKKLMGKGFEVIPVNPKYEEIEGLKCYPNVNSIPLNIDCVDFVVPPALTMKAVENIDPKKIESLWMQPGSFNNEVVKTAEEKGFKVVHGGACVMIASNMAEGF